MDGLNSTLFDNNGSSTVDLGPLGNAASSSTQASWDQAMADAGLDGGNDTDDGGWGNADRSMPSFNIQVSADVVDRPQGAAPPGSVPSGGQMEAGGATASQGISPAPDAAAASQSSGNPYARRPGESAHNWAGRLIDESNSLTRLHDTDPAKADSGRLRMNDAIASDPDFRDTYFASAQGLTAEAFYNPAQYGTPVSDRSVGFRSPPNESVEERLRNFAATNQNPAVHMGADGVIYDFSKSPSQIGQAPSELASVYRYNEQATNHLGERIHEHGLAAVPADVWAMSMLGVARSARGPDVERVGSRWPYNSGYAGQTYPVQKLPPDLQTKYPERVNFTPQGYPDFSPYAKARTQPGTLSGNYEKDERLANKFVGLPKTPDGYTWHHLEDGKTMLIVPKDIHKAVRHTGGVANIKNGGVDQ